MVIWYILITRRRCIHLLCSFIIKVLVDQIGLMNNVQRGQRSGYLYLVIHRWRRYDLYGNQKGRLCALAFVTN